MKEQTPEQVWNLFVYGTVALALMIVGIASLVIYLKGKQRKDREGLQRLREQHKNETCYGKDPD